MRQLRSAVLASVAPLALALVLGSCGGGSETPTTPANNTNTGGTGNPPGGGGGPTGGGGFPTTASVTVSDNQFTPASVTIARTGTVTWTWAGGGYGVAHNVTFTDGDSGDKTEGTYAKSFASTGVFTYRCTNHPATMTGTVDVR